MERFRRTGLRGRGKGRGKNRFLMGAAILSVSGLICKVIGAFYRIPLQNNILGLDGISLYQLAYPVYSMLLVISTSGLATAISKMVAERVVQQDFRGAYRTFKISRNVLIVIGLVTTLIMILGNDLITAIQGDPLAAPVNLAIAPALFFVSLMSAYRGYFQGMQDMVPTGVSQLLEQVGKLAIGFPLAALGMQLGAQQGAGSAASRPGNSPSNTVPPGPCWASPSRRSWLCSSSWLCTCAAARSSSAGNAGKRSTPPYPPSPWSSA